MATVPDLSPQPDPDQPPGPGAGSQPPLGPLSITARTRLRRMREKGQADRESLFAVLEAGWVAHLGVVIDGWPMVIPTVYGFDAHTLYLHGSVASQSLGTDGTPVCVTVTLVDGLVLARSVFEHSVNYRSAMIYGLPRLVTDPAERLAGLRCVAEHVAPGQWEYARQPNRKELAATKLLALPLAEASVKLRSGPPDDGESKDAELGLWAGVLPLATVWQDPVPDPLLPPGIEVPAHIRARAGTAAGRDRLGLSQRRRGRRLGKPLPGERGGQRERAGGDGGGDHD